MRIFTKKSFEFKNADGEKVTTRPLDFADVPDWVTSDPLFAWGKKDGDITVTGTAQDEKAATDAAEADAAAKAAAAKAAVDAEEKTKADSAAKDAAAPADDAKKGK